MSNLDDLKARWDIQQAEYEAIRKEIEKNKPTVHVTVIEVLTEQRRRMKMRGETCITAADVIAAEGGTP